MVREGYKQTEVGVIPEDWEVATLDELGSFKNGLNKGKEAFGHGSFFVNLMDVFGKTRIDPEDVKELVDSSVDEQNMYSLIRGDVLFIRSSVKPSGVGLTALVTNDIPTATYSGFLIRFRPNDRLHEGFREYCFYSKNFRKRLIAGSSVSANTNVNQSTLGKLRVAFPASIQEQTAIASALSATDALLAAQDALIAKKEAFKRGMMEALLSGERRLEECRNEWEEVLLSRYLKMQVGFPFSSTYFNKKGNGLRLIKNRDLKSEDSKIYYSGSYSDDFLVRAGDILVGMDGDFILSKWNGLPSLLNQRIGRLLVNTSYIDDGYIFYALAEKLKEIEYETGATTVKHLSHSDVENIKMLLPPLPEQRAIAALLTSLDDELSALRARRAKLVKIKAGMMEVLLTGAVRLV